jgi:hypothetical protein
MQLPVAMHLADRPAGQVLCVSSHFRFIDPPHVFAPHFACKAIQRTPRVVDRPGRFPLRSKMQQISLDGCCEFVHF